MCSRRRPAAVSRVHKIAVSCARSGPRHVCAPRRGCGPHCVYAPRSTLILEIRPTRVLAAPPICVWAPQPIRVIAPPPFNDCAPLAPSHKLAPPPWPPRVTERAVAAMSCPCYRCACALVRASRSSRSLSCVRSHRRSRSRIAFACTPLRLDYCSRIVVSTSFILYAYRSFLLDLSLPYPFYSLTVVRRLRCRSHLYDFFVALLVSQIYFPIECIPVVKEYADSAPRMEIPPP